MKMPMISESEVTDEKAFLNRREVLRLGATAVVGAALAGCPAVDDAEAKSPSASGALRKLDNIKSAAPAFRTDEELTSESDATSYNNFYEFGTDKKDPSRNKKANRCLEQPPVSRSLYGGVGGCLMEFHSN